jgi:uncharacterized iron-regulated membrane protein
MMTNKRIRNRLFIAHRYIGLAVGTLAAVIGLTGSLLIINDWAEQLSIFAESITPTGDRIPLDQLIAISKQAQPNLTLERLEFPNQLTEPATAWWLAPEDKLSSALLNPYTGKFLNPPKIEGYSYSKFLYDVHITLMGGEWGGYVAGIVGLLSTVLCITGIALWPGWRKLTTGFKIKWNAHIKRLNFDLHKVAGIIAAVFLAMAMFTGFIWNYGTWANPLIYALTLSPQPAAEVSSQAIAGKSPLPITAGLLEKASAALPSGNITLISLPTESTGVIGVSKQLPNQSVVSASLDQFSGEILRTEGWPDRQSLGDRVLGSFKLVHSGTFAGEASQILYVFVGLSPSILLITGFMMWWHRHRGQSDQQSQSKTSRSRSTTQSHF